MTGPTYLSDMRPDFMPFEINCGKIIAYRYKGDLKQELAKKRMTKADAISLLEDMLMIRELEEMIVKLRSGAYEPIRDFNYRGPTHVSVGQEATAAGACSALRIADKITSTHRGHGESLAKGTVAIRSMSDKQLQARVPDVKAMPDDLSGGTFTITNMGMLDVENFGAIINPGEGAILAVASAKPQPVVRDDKIVARQMMKITLSCDHRVVDGALGARFANAIKAKLEDIELWKRLAA